MKRKSGSSPPTGTIPYMIPVVPIPVNSPIIMIGPVPAAPPNSLLFPIQPAQAEKPREEDVKHHFTEQDDTRLIEIMQHHPRPLKCREWYKIAQEMGDFSARQCRERWHNYLKPPLDRSEFSIKERREIVKLATETPGGWKSIADKLPNKSRSPAMIKNLLTNLFQKMDRLGVRPTCPEEVDCVPDSVFGWGTPKKQAAAHIRTEFLQKKAELYRTMRNTQIESK